MPYETVKLSGVEKADVFIDKDGAFTLEKYQIFNKMLNKWIKIDLEVLFRTQREEYDQLIADVEFKVDNQMFSKE